MSFAQKFQKSLTEKWCLRIKTRHPQSNNYDGVVMLIKPTFILLYEQYDFEFDGLIILPKKIIKGCRDNKYDKCFNEILRQNGAIKKLRIPAWLTTCQTIPQILTELMTRGIWPGIEHLATDHTETAFYIGSIKDTTKDGIYIYCYDAAGKWEKEYYLNYQNIFKIEINSKYCKYFNHYMRSHLRT